MTILLFVVNAHAAAELSVGLSAPEWTVDNWANSEPLKLADLRGSVVLVRWFTSSECPYCSATAPALNEFDAMYKEKCLRVIGLYQHKRRTEFSRDEYIKCAAQYGFTFPIAVDSRAQTLNLWWLAGERKQFTSVSFLIDRKGIVRFVHPGGKYVKGDADYSALKSKIEELLSEK